MEAAHHDKEATVTDLGWLLDAEDDAAVTLIAGDTRLLAHRAVLRDRSPVFEVMFQHDMMEATSGSVVIPDVEGAVLRHFVAYLYKLQVPQLPGLAPQLLVVAEKYGVVALKKACEQQVAEQLSVETAAAAAVLAIRHSCSGLREAAVAFIKTHTHQVMATDGWAEAVRRQHDDVVELSRLLSTTSSPPPEESGTCPQPAAQPPSAGSQSSAPASAPASAAAASSRAPPPEDDAVSRLRRISADEKGRRLREAAKQGAVGQLEALLAAGADVAAREGDMMTALHWAAVEGHEEAARRLLAAGAAVDARSNCQATPLHLAAKYGHAAVVRLLLAAGAYHSARQLEGWTPLHFAAFNSRKQAAAALVEAGADRAARDNDGDTPLDTARLKNQQQVVQLLEGC